MRRVFLLVALAGVLWPSLAAAQNRSRAEVRGTLGADGQCLTLPVDNMATGVWDIRGTFSLTVAFSVGIGNNFVAVDANEPSAPGTADNDTTTAGAWVAPIAGFQYMRACVTSYASGSASVTLSAAAVGGGSTSSTALSAESSAYDATSDALKNILVDPTTGAALNPLESGTSYSTGLSTAAVVSAQIKGSAGTLLSLQCFNNGANEVFVRLYNQTGAPANTDTANIVWRGFVPGNAAAAGFGFEFGPSGKSFATGIGIRVTAAVADNDNTSLSANEVVCNADYN